MYSRRDRKRVIDIVGADGFAPEAYRSEFRRDLARLLHSPSFRRLQGKTQLYPGRESDFFRNRLTHSLEVAQIAKSIAHRLNHLSGNKARQRIDIDLVEFCALAHDIGHPPFGHLGEKVLDELMMDEGGFEGNAQTLRILTVLEKRHLDEGSIDETGFHREQKGLITDCRVGLNLTRRSLLGVLKYERIIPPTRKERTALQQRGDLTSTSPVKGIYKSDEVLIRECIQEIYGDSELNFGRKSIECQIMEFADDIAYSTYDLEDSFKAGFMTPLKMIASGEELLSRVVDSMNRSINNLDWNVSDAKDALLSIFRELYPSIQLGPNVTAESNGLIEAISEFAASFVHQSSEKVASNGYYRTAFTSKLVGKFIRAIEFENQDDRVTVNSKISMSTECRVQLELLKQMNYHSMIMSSKLRVVEYRGREIIERIFTALEDEGRGGHHLLPKDFRSFYDICKGRDDLKKRVICDFIAGMTDRYAIEFYGRLTSENPETIFKPL